MERPTWIDLFGKVKPFRAFVQKCYCSNQREREEFKDTAISFDEYFKNNKWFIKRKYQKETRIKN